jgi:diguanylate cyclase (GGDEF)-like protein
MGKMGDAVSTAETSARRHRLGAAIAGRLRLSPLVDLARHRLMSRRAFPALDKARARVMSARVRGGAAALTLLTGILVAVEFALFGGAMPAWFAAGQAAAALPLLLLALPSKGAADLHEVRTELAALFGLPLMYFLFAMLVLPSLIDGGPHRAAILAVYGQVPFLLAAAISLFPLTAVEALAGAAAILLAAAVDGHLREGATSPDGAAGHIGLLALVLCVSAAAGMSQFALLAQMIDRSARDPLTGLLTRQFGLELVEAQFRIAERQGTPLAALFVDLDRLKPVNDGHGHEAGDELLRRAAAGLLATFRGQDVAVRWGGEEFVVLLPNTDSAGARNAVRRLAETGLGRRPDGAAQTASIGMAERKADTATDWAHLLEIADERMQAAKEAGRNAWLDGGGRPAAFLPPRPRDGAAA